MDESIVKHLSQQTLTLSQAIRIGARIRPQCTTVPFFEGHSCAIGAAYEGATGKYVDGADQTMLMGELRASGVWPPGLSSIVVWKKNDLAGWTREAIADWLESQGY